jgi:ribosomal protein S14
MRKLRNNLVFNTFKKSFIVPELQSLRNTNYINNIYLTENKRSRNKCLYTSRSRAILSITRSSRHQFRVFARAGILCGIKKASW